MRYLAAAKMPRNNAISLSFGPEISEHSAGEEFQLWGLNTIKLPKLKISLKIVQDNISNYIGIKLLSISSLFQFSSFLATHLSKGSRLNPRSRPPQQLWLISIESHHIDIAWHNPSRFHKCHRGKNNRLKLPNIHACIVSRRHRMFFHPITSR